MLSLTADGYGDVFYGTSSGDLYELVDAANLPAVPVPVKINTITLGTPSKIMIDTNNVIWASSGGNYVTGTTGALQPTTPPSLGGFHTVSYTMSGPSYAVAGNTPLRFH